MTYAEQLRHLALAERRRREVAKRTSDERPPRSYDEFLDRVLEAGARRGTER